MKKSCIGKLRIALLIIVLALCILPVVAFATSWSTVEPYYDDSGEKSEDKQYLYVITETSRGEIVPVTDKEIIHFPYTNDSAAEDDFDYQHSEKWHWHVDPSVEFGTILTRFKVDVEYGEETENGIEVHTKLAPYHTIYIYETPVTQSVSLQVTEILQERSATNPNEWKNVETRTTNKQATRYSKHFRKNIPHPADKSNPAERGQYNGVIKSYHCIYPGCEETVEAVFSEHQHDNKGATCTTRGECSVCGKYGKALGHDFDYEHPAATASRYVVYYYCKNYGCMEYESHSHQFKTVKVLKQADDYKQIKDDNVNHLVKDIELQQCDCGATINEEVWHSEPHTTWTTLDSKPATCLEDGYIDETCDACSKEKTTILKTPGHDWLNGPAVSSQTFQLNKLIMSLFMSNAYADTGLNLDMLQHCNVCHKTNCDIYGHSWNDATCTDPKRCTRCKKTDGDKRGHTYDYSRPETTSNGVRFPCKYGCAGVYDYHSHSFEDDKNTAAVKTNNLQKNDATYHKRRYDIKQVCNSKLGNGATCGTSKWRYDWRNEKHTSMEKTETKAATCTADGYDKFACSDNCGYTRTDTIKAHGHVYDYSRPEGTSTGYRFPCKYGCAGVYDSHSHSFVDSGEAAVKTNNLQKSDATNHKRRYDIKQVCNQKWGNGAKCGATKWRYDWRNETHSLTNNGDATKTNTYQQISGNASQHNRKTTQPQKCACGYTKPKEGWIKESHSWHNDVLAKAATCTTQGSRKRMCIYCDYVNTYSTAIDPNNHNWSGEPKCLTGASCTNGCGATKPALGHNYSGWTLVRTPTATDRGQLKRTCYRCGQVHYKPAR